MRLITDSKELEFKNEYDSQLNVYYEGEPFSGVLKEETEEIKYESGNAVHVINYYGNGQKAFEEFLLNGAQLETYSWYEDGTVKSEAKHDYAYFNETGTVLTTGFSLHSNGELASKSENGIGKYFSQNGILIGETKWTPKEKYRKEYYLNGVLKYHSLPSINKSFHFTDKYYLVIDKDDTHGRSNIYFDKIVIDTYIHELYFSEGKEYGFSKYADEIRINNLMTWLVNTVQLDDPNKYLSLNFKLCFCKDKNQAELAFKRLVIKLDNEAIEKFVIPDIPSIENSDKQDMIERLKIEIAKK